MPVLSIVKENFYQDSMKLMQLSKKLSKVEGISRASAIMATEANLNLLKDAGLYGEIPDAVSANDLIVTVEADSEEIARGAIDNLDSLLTSLPITTAYGMEVNTLESAYSELPGANFAVISVPGIYAKIEAAKAIEKGLHTFLFSSNVKIEEEIELKRRASGKGLLMMGPDSGTAIINGIGLGFSNVVRKGPIGVIAAAGTGLQEVTSLINNWGSGISHAIGVRGRDLSESVGGIMTIESIRMLKGDENTKALLLISKPPAARIGKKVIEEVLESGLPACICFLGRSEREKSLNSVHFAFTLSDAAYKAIELVNINGDIPTYTLDKKAEKDIKNIAKSFSPSQRYLRGLFSGGTLCYESQQILNPILGRVYSNAPIDKKNKLKDSNISRGHSCIDLGSEEFTEGRLHPMIDATTRNERLIREASDSSVAVVLFDVVLGYVASPDPAGDLIPAINHAKDIARRKARSLAFVAHVCGTSEDPQNLKSQEKKLKRAGVLVFPTNSLASHAAARILRND